MATAVPSISYPDGVTADRRSDPRQRLPGFRPLNLDIYLPRPAPKPLPKPALIFLHGGAWNSGDRRHASGFDDLPAALASLAAQNYVVVSLDYRLSAEAHFPAPVQDVKSAVRWLRANAQDYGIDTTRIAIWGTEAGGHLAALTGTSCGVAVLEPSGANDDKQASDCVNAVIAWDAITDLAGLATDRGGDAAAATAEGAFLGCEPAQCAPGLVRTASPLAYIGPNSPPFLIQQGLDKTVPSAQTQKLYAWR